MMDDIDAVIARIVGPTTQQKKWVPKEAQLELLEACVRGTIRNLRANNVPLRHKVVADAAWQWFRMLVIHNLHQKELGPLVKKHISALGGEFNEAIRPKYEVETLATEAARTVLNKACADFVARARRHERPQIGIRVTTGVGKTRGIVRAIAEDIKANGSPVAVALLGANSQTRLRNRGLVCRGRSPRPRIQGPPSIHRPGQKRAADVQEARAGEDGIGRWP